VIAGGEVVLLRAARIVFFIIIGFPEVFWNGGGSTGCRGNLHWFPAGFYIVGGNLWCWFIGVVFVTIFLDKFQCMVEVLDRLPRVIRSLIALPVYQEFVSVVLAPVIEYLLCFPFFCIIDKNRGGFVHPSGCNAIGIILIVCFEAGDVKIWLLSGHVAG